MSVACLAYFFPVLYIVDILCIILQSFGFTFHIEGSIPLLFYQLAYNSFAASFLTAFKVRYLGQPSTQDATNATLTQYSTLIAEKVIGDIRSDCLLSNEQRFTIRNQLHIDLDHTKITT